MKTRFTLLFLLLSTVLFAQNGQKSISGAFDFIKDQEYAYYFEVSKEMFKMMTDAEGITPQYKDYMSKLSSLKMVRSNRNSPQGNDLYDIFMDNVNLKDFSMLMTSTQPGRKISFYKKTNNSENQFLLVSNTTVIYITGTIDIKSLQEFERIMEIAGGAMDM